MVTRIYSQDNSYDINGQDQTMRYKNIFKQIHIYNNGYHIKKKLILLSESKFG